MEIPVMRKEILLAPAWRTAPVVCPRCKAPAQAKYNPNNGALEALRCPHCNWTQDFVLIAKKRTARLNAMRRKNPRSTDLQQPLDTKGNPDHGH